jgi:hypothetical protein
VSRWNRIEGMARSIGLAGGLEARIADPLWMLARQWQVAEFRGDDAAQPAAVRMTGQNVLLTALQGYSGAQQQLPATAPLDAVVETTPGPDFGAAGLHASVRASRRLIRLLTTAGLSRAVDALRSAFPLRVPDRLVQFGNTGTQVAAFFARRGIDAVALARADANVVGQALAAVLTPAEKTRAESIITAWEAWYRRRDGETRNLAWNDERLEYTFALRTGDGSATNSTQVELQAPEHDGGHLDWYTFDVVSTSSRPAGRQQRTHTALPTPVRYRGMPAARWWQFEDGTVNFGDLEAGPADLARLLVAEFATVYSRDWFVVPITVPVGSLSQITHLEVIDNFGGRSRIHSTAANDAKRTGGTRVWRMFELTGDAVDDEQPAPWLLVAPTLASDINGPILERVALTRDEGANLVWAIEGLVEGLLGRAVNRAEAWYAAQPDESPPAAPAGATPQTYDAQWWRYRLESPAPAWWIPFLPERIRRDQPQVRLRRARMQAWELYTDVRVASQIGPQGLFLDPRRPCWLNEEEVPRSGIRLERRWQFGRWHDGSYHVWLQRRKFAGRGERSSGLRWDALLPAPRDNAT